MGLAAGSVAASSTSDAPPPQPGPSQPEAAAKAPALPTPKPSSPVISMTAALKNVGAVSIHLQSLPSLTAFQGIYLLCVLQTTPLKENLPEPEPATAIQVRFVLKNRLMKQRDRLLF